MEDIKHIGIILDGNRRWAKEKGLPPFLGHKKGAETLETLVREADKIGLKYLSVYIFSTENWKRKNNEVAYLMGLFSIYFKNMIKRVDKENIRIQFFGSDEGVHKRLIKYKKELIKSTKNKKGLQLNICFNYGGRKEIVDTFKKILEKYSKNEISIDDINEKLISDNLYSSGVPDPDLIIRTSGEKRLSNFLTWQSSYSELLFIDKNWPDFTIDDLKEAIEEYRRRERRFGGK